MDIGTKLAIFGSIPKAYNSWFQLPFASATSVGLIVHSAALARSSRESVDQSANSQVSRGNDCITSAYDCALLRRASADQWRGASCGINVWLQNKRVQLVLARLLSKLVSVHEPCASYPRSGCHLDSQGTPLSVRSKPRHLQRFRRCPGSHLSLEQQIIGPT